MTIMLTAKEEQRARTMYQQGYTLRHIARKLDCQVKDIREVTVDLQEQRSGQRRNYWDDLTAEQRAARQMQDDGYPDHVIIANFGLDALR